MVESCVEPGQAQGQDRLAGGHTRAAVRRSRHVGPDPERLEEGAQRVGGQVATEVVGVAGQGSVHRTGDVAGDRVDRLGLTAEPLGRPDVEQHPVTRQPGGLAVVDGRESAREPCPVAGDRRRDGLRRDRAPGCRPGRESAVEDQHVVVPMVAE